MIFSVCCIALVPSTAAFPSENNWHTDNHTVSVNNSDYATIDGENFTSQNVTDLNVTNQILTNQSFSHQNITNRNFTNQNIAPQNFSDQNFTNQELNNRNFTRQKISNRNFTYQNFTNQSSYMTASAPRLASALVYQYNTPLCPAGTAFDASAYPQNTPQSAPMTVSCNWDGTGHVYLSGDESAVTGIYADDDISVTVQPSGGGFTTAEHYACQHPAIDLTSMMRPGSNTITITILNTQYLSMSYGSSSGTGIDQVPTIVQATDTPPLCSSGKTVDTSYPVIIFNALLELVRIKDFNGAVTHYFLVLGNHTVYNACPSGPGAYTVTSDLIFYDCYTCVNTTPTPPTTEPTPNTTTPTVTPTPGLTFTPVPNDPTRAPIADFTATPLSGTAPLTVHFTDTSTRSPSRWTWLFGDGTSSTLRNPVHNYSTPGTYDVSLTAANAYGTDTERKAEYVRVKYTFSITQVGKIYSTDDSLIANDTSYWVYKVLHDDNHWQNIFWKKESDVSKEDFGTQGGGLNNAIFHFHVGHGGHDLLGSNTSLDIGNWQSLHASDVERKWGGNNKWVLLYSCDVLDDPSWAKALNTTHGIFGFTTEVPADINVPVSFFNYASSSSNPRTLVEAFNNATGPVFNSKTTAKIIFGTKEQYDTDHLPGFGIIAPDRASNDHSYFQRSWICWGKEGVKQ
jgi:PKD repeat protein